MGLKRKLRRLSGVGGSGGGRRSGGGRASGSDGASDSGGDKADKIRRLRSELSALQQREGKRRRKKPAPTPEDATLPGDFIETPHGHVHLIQQYLEPHHCHGHAPVVDARQVCSERVAQLAIDPVLADIDLTKALYLDTETTGLAGGMGTVPFLVGVGWFEDESLHLQQYFLRELGEEKPLLRLLADRIAESECIVTFNGKTFDWPLLRNRFVANRVKLPDQHAHLDLLHCARRVLKPRLGSVRLVQLEREVLGFYREDDVPGALIPQIYFDYLDGGEVSPLLGVFEHNANDIIALAALLAKLTEHFDAVHDEDDPLDHLAYAKVAARNGDGARAHAFAMAAASGGGDSLCTVEAWMMAAKLARRGGDIDEEERALREALQAADTDNLEAAVSLALAKLLEHRRKDLQAALEHAALTVLAEGEDANARRVARIERRLEKNAR